MDRAIPAFENRSLARSVPRPPRRAALAALALLALVAVPEARSQGTALPGLEQGQRLEERDLQRGVVILVAWASWSPRCRDIVQRVNAIESVWGDRARVITVNFQEDPATVREFLASQRPPLRVPVFLDRDAGFSKRHAVTYLPGLLVLRDGAQAYGGKLPADPDALLRQVLD